MLVLAEVESIFFIVGSRGAMFWVYGGKSFDSSGNIFVFAEQCLHRAFFTSHTTPPVSSLVAHKK